MSFSPNIINKSIEDRISAKRTKIHSIKDECKLKIKVFKKKYKKLKRIDNCLDISNSFLNASSIALIISGISLPPLLIISASCSGINFVLGRIQDKVNLKQKIEQLKQSINQYSSIINEIVVVLSKNNLSSNEYSNYMQEIYDKISLLEEYGQIV